jgi:hypothetical protein
MVNGERGQVVALTLDKEQKLDSAGLADFYDEHAPIWSDLAQKSFEFVKGNFPTDSRVRPDDVAKALEPLLEVNEDLKKYLSANKLKQKYWTGWFTELVIDRTWNNISGDNNGT